MFKFSYAHDKNAFNVRSDGSQYTISELTWTYLPDYEVYNFVLKDLKIFDVNSLKETLISDSIAYSFDVSINGEFVRLFANIKCVAWYSRF